MYNMQAVIRKNINNTQHQIQSAIFIENENRSGTNCKLKKDQ